MISLYGFEFSWNRFLGYSVLKDPMELIGLVIILVILAIVTVIIPKLFKTYKDLRDSATFAWLLTFIFLEAAIIFLIFEKVSYSTLGLIDLGDIMAIIAFSCVSVAIVSINYFTFNMTYPDHKKILTMIVLILTIIHNIVLIFAILSGPPYADVINYELVYDISINRIVYPILLSIILIPPIIFFYFSSKSREENRPNSIRALWMGIGIICFDIGYLTEVAPIFPTELSIPLRILFAVAALIMYVCFSMPDWFKKKIGWID
ncbi:MAG: hypothetical protein ACFFDN_33560 [Candidatus Hodarchaeota archaeon]